MSLRAVGLGAVYAARRATKLQALSIHYTERESGQVDEVRVRILGTMSSALTGTGVVLFCVDKSAFIYDTYTSVSLASLARSAAHRGVAPYPAEEAA